MPKTHGKTRDLLKKNQDKTFSGGQPGTGTHHSTQGTSFITVQGRGKGEGGTGKKKKSPGRDST